MKDKRLFLKFVLLNAVTVVFLAGLGLLYGGKVHGAPAVAAPVIFAVALFAQIGGGRICWQADAGLGLLERKRLLHEAKYLGHWAWTAQIIGILSTVLGFWTLLTGGGGDQQLHARIQQGGGVALVGTFVGILASLLLVQTERMIEHELGS